MKRLRIKNREYFVYENWLFFEQLDKNTFDECKKEDGRYNFRDRQIVARIELLNESMVD